MAITVRLDIRVSCVPDRQPPWCAELFFSRGYSFQEGGETAFEAIGRVCRTWFGQCGSLLVWENPYVEDAQLTRAFEEMTTTCHRCQETSDALIYIAELNNLLCDSCLELWDLLKAHTNNWGRDEWESTTNPRRKT